MYTGIQILALTNGEWVTLFICAFTVPTGIIGWFLIRTCSQIDRRFEQNDAEFETNKALFRKIYKWMKKIEQRLTGVEQRLAKVENIVDISGRTGLLGRQSPIALTEKGRKAVQDSGIRDMIDLHKDVLLAELKKGNPSTAYDIQETCYRLLEEYDFGPENMARLKDYVYQNGEIILSQLQRAGAIYFRDIALKELGIDTAELDKKS